ncbi:MAG: T9SS type A sorting domain-containing protein [Chitinophagaceae bacterium]
MKLKIFTQPLLAVILTMLCCNLLLLQCGIASGNSNKKYLAARIEPVKEEPAKKSGTFSARNNNAVRIHPDIIKREMHVIAKENDGKEINFFVFDLQGTLMQHFKMKYKDHYRLQGLEKGVYIYRVFCGDEETVSGKFEIR